MGRGSWVEGRGSRGEVVEGVFEIPDFTRVTCTKSHNPTSILSMKSS